jgi:hypothetical protein
VTTNRTYYPAERADGYAYYADDGAWWMSRTDAPDTDRQSVLLLDVLVGVTDQMRGLVIEEHDRMAAASITTLYQTIREGRHGEVTTQIVQLQHAARDYRSINSAEVAS